MLTYNTATPQRRNAETTTTDERITNAKTEPLITVTTTTGQVKPQKNATTFIYPVPPMSGWLLWVLPGLLPSLIILVVRRSLGGKLHFVWQRCQLLSPSADTLSPLLCYRISLMRFIAVLPSLLLLPSSSIPTQAHVDEDNCIWVPFVGSYEYIDIGEGL